MAASYVNNHCNLRIIFAVICEKSYKSRHKLRRHCRGSTLIYRFYELNAPGRTFARAQYPGLQPMAGAL